MAYFPQLNKLLKQHGFHVEWDPRTRDEGRNHLGIQFKKSKDHDDRVIVADWGSEPWTAFAFVIALGYGLRMEENGSISLIEKETPNQ